jgi:hypothetical protein
MPKNDLHAGARSVLFQKAVGTLARATGQLLQDSQLSFERTCLPFCGPADRIEASIPSNVPEPEWPKTHTVLRSLEKGFKITVFPEKTQCRSGSGR